MFEYYARIFTMPEFLIESFPVAQPDLVRIRQEYARLFNGLHLYRKLTPLPEIFDIEKGNIFTSGSIEPGVSRATYPTILFQCILRRQLGGIVTGPIGQPVIGDYDLPVLQSCPATDRKASCKKSRRLKIMIMTETFGTGLKLPS